MSTENSARPVKVVVLCRNSNGAPEFYQATVRVTPAELDEGLHYELAKAAADEEGYDAVLAFDKTDPAARQLGDLLVWL